MLDDRSTRQFVKSTVDCPLDDFQSDFVGNFES